MVNGEQNVQAYLREWKIIELSENIARTPLGRAEDPVRRSVAKRELYNKEGKKCVYGYT